MIGPIVAKGLSPCWIVLFDASRRIGAEGFGGATVGSLFALWVGAMALIDFGCRTVAAGMKFPYFALG